LDGGLPGTEERLKMKRGEGNEGYKDEDYEYWRQIKRRIATRRTTLMRIIAKVRLIRRTMTGSSSST